MTASIAFASAAMVFVSVHGEAERYGSFREKLPGLAADAGSAFLLVWLLGQGCLAAALFVRGLFR